MTTGRSFLALYGASPRARLRGIRLRPGTPPANTPASTPASTPAADAPASPPAAAPAREPSAIERARASTWSAVRVYISGRFIEAAEEFQVAYEAQPFSAFLYNAAVAYGKQGDLPRAVDFFGVISSA